MCVCVRCVCVRCECVCRQLAPSERESLFIFSQKHLRTTHRLGTLCAGIIRCSGYLLSELESSGIAKGCQRSYTSLLSLQQPICIPYFVFLSARRPNDPLGFVCKVKILVSQVVIPSSSDFMISSFEFEFNSFQILLNFV